MKKYRLFGKIPVFDIIIIAIVLIAAIVFYNVFMTSKSGEIIVNSQTKTIRYTVDFLNISNTVDGIPDVGEKVYETSTNYFVGTVVSAQAKPFVNYSYNEVTGEPTSTTYNDRQTISIVIEASAVVSERSTEVNGVKLGIGKTTTFNMPSLCAMGVVVNMEEV